MYSATQREVDEFDIDLEEFSDEIEHGLSTIQKNRLRTAECSRLTLRNGKEEQISKGDHC